MSDTIISVQKLSKRYTLGANKASSERYVALRDVIAREVRALPGRAAQLFSRSLAPEERLTEFWALKDVSFEVKRGEVLGVIGRNGAGKSTLLKVLSRITEPTEGRVELRGRVASLLEVGTGFHPELTGRENIFLNGAVLGMTQREVWKKLDEIVAFAEVERFLDTPVKRYSSGMYVRLAFAVAAHLEPDVLIVDEVLAVGDAVFQRKCLGKIGSIASSGERTVIFVSHHMGTVASICDRAVVLQAGRVAYVGETAEALLCYQNQATETGTGEIRLEGVARRGTHGSRLRLKKIEWMNGVPLRHAGDVELRIEFEVFEPIVGLAIGVGFCATDGRRLLTCDSDYPRPDLMSIERPGTYSVDITLSDLPLGPGSYLIDIGARQDTSVELDYLPACASIEVLPGPETPDSMIRPDSGVRLRVRRSNPSIWRENRTGGSITYS